MILLGFSSSPLLLLLLQTLQLQEVYSAGGRTTDEGLLSLRVSRAEQPIMDNGAPTTRMATLERTKMVDDAVESTNDEEDNDGGGDPCYGAASLSLQVQLWCEYYHSLGLF